jgi:hypothetical protein
MARLHLFEIEDQPWCPAWVRDAGTDWIAMILKLSGHSQRLAGVFKEQLTKAGTREVVDLASGGGGPMPVLVDAVVAEGGDVHVTMTDLFPNLPAFERVVARYPGRFAFRATPVDATAVPADLPGMRLMFNSFHHLPPNLALNVLTDAAEKGKSIAIFEVVERSPVGILGITLGTLFSPITLPMTNPRRWERWVFSWIIPVLPAFVWWDGTVSCFRIYSPTELRALTEQVNVPGYTWEVRRVPLGGPATATCLFGHPGAA